MPSPTRDAATVLIARFFAAWPEDPGISAEAVATQIGHTSFAELFEFCQNIRRHHILSQGSETLKSILARELKLWKTRIKPMSDGQPAPTTIASTGEPSPDSKANWKRLRSSSEI
jgi:hypothetical protein